MAENKKSFMFYCDWQETFNTLPNDKAGELIKHVLSYVNDENPQTDDLLINAVFANIKNALKRDLKKWEDKQTQNSDAGNLSAFNRFKKRIPKNVSKDDLLFEIGYCDKKRIECLKMDQPTKYWDMCLTHLNIVQHESTDVKNVATESSVKDRDKVKDKVIVKKSILDRKADFKKSLYPFKDFGIDTLKEFFEYWTEHGDNDRKMRFEKEKSFGLSRRLSTWIKRQKIFNKEKNSNKKEKPVMLTQTLRKKYGIE